MGVSSGFGVDWWLDTADCTCTCCTCASSTGTDFAASMRSTMLRDRVISCLFMALRFSEARSLVDRARVGDVGLDGRRGEDGCDA